ncbi:MAG: inositol-3-phosphate synthase [Acidimicrobiia bacterium]
MGSEHAGEPIGVWLVGARGSVATTTIAGCAAIASGLAPPTGMVTALGAFDDVPLPALGDLVFGGCDLVEVPLAKRAEALTQAGVLPAGLQALVDDALDAADADIVPGISTEDPPLAAIERVVESLGAFRSAHRLDRVVVVNCATTEAPAAHDDAHRDLGALEGALASGRDVLPPSSLYAYAAFESGCGFVDFTPSTGARLPALAALAERRRVPHAGRDGKTGETLVKSALAAMFVDRHLDVRSWAGVNLLGGGDGAALADPDRAQSKRHSKGRALAAILGTEVEAPTEIVNVVDLGEWKTAWDRVSFAGFLGTRMRLEFTWEGADSTLAAPLVLDLARLVGAAHLAGRCGPIPELGYFFKDPDPGGEHRLDLALAALRRWAASL